MTKNDEREQGVDWLYGREDKKRDWTSVGGLIQKGTKLLIDKKVQIGIERMLFEVSYPLS